MNSGKMPQRVAATGFAAGAAPASSAASCAAPAAATAGAVPDAKFQVASLASVVEAAAGLALSDAPSSTPASVEENGWEEHCSDSSAPASAAATLSCAEPHASAALDSSSADRGEPASSSSNSSAKGSAGSPSTSAAGGWAPSSAELAASPHHPLLVAAHQGLPYQRIHSANPRSLPVNDGSPIEFDSPLFSGRACLWVRGLPSPGPSTGTGSGAGSNTSTSTGTSTGTGAASASGPASTSTSTGLGAAAAAGAPDPAAAMFKGRQRRTLVTVQGRFKRPVPLDDLVTGQEFGRVENLPAAWFVERVLLKVARAVSPSMQVGPLSAPHMLMPVAAGCSEMCASRPGQEPDPAAPPREDLRLWDAGLSLPDGSPLPAAKRKAHFSRAGNRAGRCFPTDLVFTFYFYQHVVDASAYELNVLYRFDLCKYLCGQPLQLMMKDRSTGEYLYCFHMWHKRLMPRSRTA